jgi:hypothetical protein
LGLQEKPSAQPEKLISPMRSTQADEEEGRRSTIS